MKNPFGWHYPAGAENDPNAPWNQKDHDSRCPLSDDYECSVCSKASHLCEDCDDGVNACICDDLEADAKADAAQAKLDAWKERGL